ncbi:UDP-N-acetylmuramoyl-tripeptide--D-alanyl-D-alanine ligase [Naumannella cuiyingiana]|uniref:UDP-N-acetylmuramoyl-tripeptide--D-alanyl-D-alanine ligase n=1 Tax=Naumannella cuiyingiana TaxID=1347891 RepID=A0A7Z0ILY5_9ACTN|nr:UDP-N-acetylmuramoyl-tripeptide--D-alanyl-D-alanine ligase [Naumannella cuiyingiana]NYI72095.1 UDP-N-acetylmuramoyl-tripeptide--D-alanyl-D-alanine ligase [Naumannella cuiyingiana]
MRSLRLDELARAVNGRLAGDPDTPVGPDVVIDSRRATPGALFVAVPGSKVDGHDFAAAAAAGGAAAALVSRPTGELPEVVVGDTVAALGLLGRDVLRRTDARVLAITGSQGKTTTKDVLAQLLEAEGPTVAPVGSYNNEYGLPLTATRVEPDTRWLISEMGARGEGHIAYLCGLTPPDVAIVLNVGQAHLGEFGDREAIARAKGELVEALSPDGWAVLNATDVRVAAMAARTAGRIAWWAVGSRPDLPGELRVWASDPDADELDRHGFVLHAESGGALASAPVRLATPGRHQIANALAAATAALVELGAEALPRVAERLGAARPRSAWRMELSTLAVPGGEALLINDAYNANPDSMLAALESLAHIARRRRAATGQGRAIAVLGDMLELGATARSEHEALGRAAGALEVDLLIAVGEYAEAAAGAAEQAGVPNVRTVTVLGSDDRTKVAGELANMLQPGDTVLVKASRAQALEELAAALAARLGEGESRGERR